MIDNCVQYAIDRFHDVPTGVSIGLLAVFCVGTVLSLSFLGIKRGWRWAVGLMLLELFVFLFCVAVVNRPVQENRLYDFTPFWSYRAIRTGTNGMWAEVIANVVAFIPIGFLLGCAFRRMTWWKAVIICGAFSAIMETLQFVLKRGVSEFDDVFHNVLGCVIGYGVYVALVYLVNRMKRSVTSNPH